MTKIKAPFLLWVILWAGIRFEAHAQLDPFPRSLLQLGYNQSVDSQGPQSLYAYYYYNNPAFLRTNVALRLAIAPVYVDGEIGFRSLLSPNTDLGIGLSGGGYGENYYEIRNGRFLKNESFDGHGGAASLNLYHLLNPGRLIPINLVFAGGARYSTYQTTDRTDDQFQLPHDRVTPFSRVGLRIAGKEPMLYPDLALELSVWFERQWRSDSGAYGFAGDRQVNPVTDLYWAYAGFSYSWTNTGQRLTAGVTVGGSENADRLNAWRLGGVLPLIAEFPLTIPGYFYQEVSASRFAHISASYYLPLCPSHRWQLRLGGAAACVENLPALMESNQWHAGAGPDLAYTSRSEVWRILLGYGYGFHALRNGGNGAHSVSLLFQYNFEQRKARRVVREQQNNGL